MFLPCILYRSCGKVMFSQVSVILFMGGCILACTGAYTPWSDTPFLGWHPLGRHPLPGQTPPPPSLGRHPLPGQTRCPLADTPSLGRHPHLGHTPSPWADTSLGRHPSDSHCSRRYASYWNAFLLILKNSRISFTASMHSSACLLPISPSMHCVGVVYPRKGVCFFGGVCCWGMSASRGWCLLLGGVCSGGGGVCFHGGMPILNSAYFTVSALGGVCSQGCLLLGVCIPACTEANTRLWTEWQTGVKT